MTYIYGPQRCSIRLKDFDYSSAGFYFITICTQNRLGLFGEIKNNKMILSPAGEMIERIWKDLPSEKAGIDLDDFTVMPDHFHGIVIIGQPRVITGQPQGLPLRSLSDIVGAFKSKTTVEYIRGVRQNNWPPFYKRLWLRNYYEHIIRSDEDLNRIREYIQNNPANWNSDEENTDSS